MADLPWAGYFFFEFIKVYLPIAVVIMFLCGGCAGVAGYWWGAYG